mgnify:CR=1 FL=1
MTTISQYLRDLADRLEGAEDASVGVSVHNLSRDFVGDFEGLSDAHWDASGLDNVYLCVGDYPFETTVWFS